MGQQVIVILAVRIAVAYDVFLHGDHKIVGTMPKLAAVFNGEAAAVEDNIPCVCSIICRNHGIGLDDDIAARFGHCADVPVASIVPVATGEEDIRRGTTYRVIDGASHCIGAREDDLSIVVGNDIGAFIVIIARDPFEAQFLAVAHGEALGLGTLHIITNFVIKVVVIGHQSQNGVGRNVHHFDGCVIPCVAITVSELKIDMTYVLRITKDRHEVEVIH